VHVLSADGDRLYASGIDDSRKAGHRGAENDLGGGVVFYERKEVC